eukprot:6464546-Amphidinium_carterae.1
MGVPVNMHDTPDNLHDNYGSHGYEPEHNSSIVGLSGKLGQTYTETEDIGISVGMREVTESLCDDFGQDDYELEHTDVPADMREDFEQVCIEAQNLCVLVDMRDIPEILRDDFGQGDHEREHNGVLVGLREDLGYVWLEKDIMGVLVDLHDVYNNLRDDFDRRNCEFEHNGALVDMREDFGLAWFETKNIGVPVVVHEVLGQTDFGYWCYLGNGDFGLTIVCGGAKTSTAAAASSSASKKRPYPLANCTMEQLEEHTREGNRRCRDLQQRQPAVLIAHGSYSPVHLGHIQMMQKARSRLRAAGIEVKVGILALANREWIWGKGAVALRDDVRVQTINRMAAAQGCGAWLSADARGVDYKSYWHMKCVNIRTPQSMACGAQTIVAGLSRKGPEFASIAKISLGRLRTWNRANLQYVKTNPTPTARPS